MAKKRKKMNKNEQIRGSGCCSRHLSSIRNDAFYILRVNSFGHLEEREELEFHLSEIIKLAAGHSEFNLDPWQCLLLYYCISYTRITKGT